MLKATRSCCSDFRYATFWRETAPNELVALAQAVLAEPATHPVVFCERIRGGSAMLADE